MKAARLHSGTDRLQLDDLPVPDATGDAVLVRVTGAGVCHSDLHIIDGMFDDIVSRPVTLGHEIAGRVAAFGADVTDLQIDEPVVVMVGWGCGHCESCVSGHEQLCAHGRTAGETTDGGFAEYVLVPHRRNVVPLGDVDPLDATPLGCAALSAYAAVKRVRKDVPGGSLLGVIGAGGLGQYAIQLARTMTGAMIAAVDARQDALERAATLGADHTVAGDAGALDELNEITGGRGASAVIDFVGSDETLDLAAGIVGGRGVVALLGLAGGSLSFSFGRLAPEASLTTVYAGTVVDLQEVVALVQAKRLVSTIETCPLDEIGTALDRLRAGAVAGRVVVTP
ncbi:MAG: NAD(P)-dependent alcohol dehydrogenase [Gaiellales bacterium]